MPAPAQFPAVVVDHERNEPAALRDFPLSSLAGELLVEVQWSSLNYKDGLAARPDGKVARSSPLVLGVDHAGVVHESRSCTDAISASPTTAGSPPGRASRSTGPCRCRRGSPRATA
jgi:hypothetical protein